MKTKRICLKKQVGIWEIIYTTYNSFFFFWGIKQGHCFDEPLWDKIHILTFTYPDLDHLLKNAVTGFEHLVLLLNFWETILDLSPCLRSWQRGWSLQVIWAAAWSKCSGRIPLLWCWTQPQTPEGLRQTPTISALKCHCQVEMSVSVGSCCTSSVSSGK